MSDPIGGVPSPCVLGSGQFLIQSLYFQNASKTGGSALAAYPMFNLRAGVSKSLDVIVETPSQVAYSGERGVGLYPLTHPGAGLLYRLAGTPRFAAALGASMSPPVSLFDPVLAQPKYAAELTSAYELSDRWALDASVAAHSSRRVGFNQVFPAGSRGLTFMPNRHTQIATSIGTRLVARRTTLQTAGGLSLSQLLTQHLSFDVGVGSAFNAVADTKSHYLGAGLNLRP